MARDPAQLLHEALELPAEARASIADSLLNSLDASVDEHAEQAWQEEIERRLDSIDRGEGELISWTEAEARLRKRLKH